MDSPARDQHKLQEETRARKAAELAVERKIAEHEMRVEAEDLKKVARREAQAKRKADKAALRSNSKKVGSWEVASVACC
jgi:hypothetical protein